MIRRKNFPLIMIGGSAGSFQVLMRLLPALPAGLHAAVIVIVHHAEDTNTDMANLFSQKCALKVHNVLDKDPIHPSTIYIAPGGYHLFVEKNLTFALSLDERHHYCRPAIDLAFESAALSAAPHLLGVILTGANADGAQGLHAILQRGGSGLVQDVASAESPQMPAAALGLCKINSTPLDLLLPGILSFVDDEVSQYATD